MGSITSAVSDDIDEYEALCRRYGEEVRYASAAGGSTPDCYGSHAEELKRRRAAELEASRASRATRENECDETERVTRARYVSLCDRLGAEVKLESDERWRSHAEWLRRIVEAEGVARNAVETLGPALGGSSLTDLLADRSQGSLEEIRAMIAASEYLSGVEATRLAVTCSRPVTEEDGVGYTSPRCGMDLPCPVHDIAERAARDRVAELDRLDSQIMSRIQLLEERVRSVGVKIQVEIAGEVVWRSTTGTWGFYHRTHRRPLLRCDRDTRAEFLRLVRGLDVIDVVSRRVAEAVAARREALGDEEVES